MRLNLNTNAHVVDVLGNVIGRDQPIMLFEKAVEFISCLDDEIISSEDVAFFDPFCKAGEILLATAFYRCLKKVSENRKLLDIDYVKKEIYESCRYFALSPDERHYRLSIRTFLGNKNSHDEAFSHIVRNGNYLSEISGKMDYDKFKMEINDMIKYIKNTSHKSKVVAIGNPPYQESDKGFGGSATAIYNHFAEALMDHNDISEFLLVIPARWFGVGKGVDDFRKRIIDSTEVKSIHYFSKSKSIFPTVDVLGGVCFFYYKKSHTGKTMFIEKEVEKEITLSELDIIPDDPCAYSIVKKVKNKHDLFLDEIAWARNPFGLTSTFFRDNKEADPKGDNVIKCYSRGRKIKYTKLNNISKNFDKVNYYKVVVPSAYAPGSKEGVRRVTLPVKQFFILDKNEICTETYTIIDIFKTRKEAERFVRYLQTDFARYLLGLRKITQHIPRDRWAWVPRLDNSKEWSDDKLFSYFSLSKAEIDNIKKKVSEWS